jgi:hypothetical protein
MRWKKKVIYSPVIGDTRIVNRFAWFPTVVDEYVIWLESYIVIEKYIGNSCFDGKAIWIDIKRNIVL